MFDPRNRPVLALDEDEISLGATVDALAEIGFPVAVAHTPSDALVLAKERDFEFFLFSHPLHGRSSEDFVREVKGLRPKLPVLLLTAPSNVERAVSMFKSGIEDYLLRPPDPLEIRARLGRIL